MKCPQCSTEIWDDSSFCSKCGTHIHPSKEGFVDHTKTIYRSPKEIIKGTIIAERYKVIEELGRGGMGIVYKAEDTKLKRSVALKFLPPELIQNEEAKGRSVLEAQAAAGLAHPNICTIHEIDEGEDRSFISMEFVEGKSLKEKIKEIPLGLEEAMDIAVQLAEGLEEAHKKDIIHRDIKSANIMVTDKGQAKIMDFGLAKVLGGTLMTREGTTMGTVAYMSPKQARGDVVDHRSDIWSLGVVLYEMLSGQLPFKGEHESSVMYAIEHKEPKPLKDLKPNIPAELEHIVGKALAKNLQDRYQHIRDLLDDLYAISKGIVPPKIKAAIRKAKLSKIKRIYVYSGIAVLSFLFITAGLYLFVLQEKAIDSIAVLPFEIVSSDPDKEYLTEGIPVSIMNMLLIAHRLKVIGRVSVFGYKGQQIDPKRIGQELDVKSVLTARWTQRGEEISIDVSLVNTKDNSLIWGKIYDTRLESVLEIVQELPAAIVKELKINLTGEETLMLAKRHTKNKEAQDLYMRGQHLWRIATEDSFKKAIEYFKMAKEADPDYALAYAGLAQCYGMLGLWGYNAPHDIWPKAKTEATKALELDDTLAEVHATLSMISLYFDWDWPDFEKHIERALELVPGIVEPHMWNAEYLRTMGRFDEAIQEMERALELEPLYIILNYWYANILDHSGRRDEALKQLNKTLELNPNFGNTYGMIGVAYNRQGKYEEAIDAFKKGIEFLGGNSPTLTGRIGAAHAKSGQKEEAMIVLRGLEEQSKQRYIPKTSIAVIYVALGEIDKAIDLLNMAYEERDPMLLLFDFKTIPYLDNIHLDPRFIALRKKMGLKW